MSSILLPAARNPKYVPGNKIVELARFKDWTIRDSD
jgi:hypothetical protein